mmetsp:Transcript_26328/g.52860  ORF Transcript_26328/g.52860 Transcript_26328/m.52860 type:complete len:250 (+) Transcript_26328:528-1277(+)
MWRLSHTRYRSSRRGARPKDCPAWRSTRFSSTRRRRNTSPRRGLSRLGRSTMPPSSRPLLPLPLLRPLERPTPMARMLARRRLQRTNPFSENIGCTSFLWSSSCRWVEAISRRQAAARAEVPVPAAAGARAQLRERHGGEMSWGRQLQRLVKASHTRWKRQTGHIAGSTGMPRLRCSMAQCDLPCGDQERDPVLCKEIVALKEGKASRDYELHYGNLFYKGGGDGQSGEHRMCVPKHMTRELLHYGQFT